MCLGLANALSCRGARETRAVARAEDHAANHNCCRRGVGVPGVEPGALSGVDPVPDGLAQRVAIAGCEDPMYLFAERCPRCSFGPGIRGRWQRNGWTTSRSGSSAANWSQTGPMTEDGGAGTGAPGKKASVDNARRSTDLSLRYMTDAPHISARDLLGQRSRSWTRDALVAWWRDPGNSACPPALRRRRPQARCGRPPPYREPAVGVCRSMGSARWRLRHRRSCPGGRHPRRSVPGRSTSTNVTLSVASLSTLTWAMRATSEGLCPHRISPCHGTTTGALGCRWRLNR